MKNFQKLITTPGIKQKFIDIDLLIPHAIKIDLNGLIYIADSGNHRILRYDSNGNYLGWIGNDERQFNSPGMTKKNLCQELNQALLKIH